MGRPGNERRATYKTRYKLTPARARRLTERKMDQLDQCSSESERVLLLAGAGEKSSVPKALSAGEETLALHLRASNIEFEREVCLITGRKWRVDFVLRPSLVVEVEGGSWQMGRHQRPQGFEQDCAKYNALTLAGYSVLRYTSDMVLRGDAIRDIMQVQAPKGEDDDASPLD